MDSKDIAIKIEEAGGRLYLVGGAIRDEFLKRPCEDEDYCVTGLTSKEFLFLFPEAKMRGKVFEVFALDGKEFAMARRESKVGIGHTEFEIQTGKEISIEEDLKRRDITINSMARDILTGEIIDPFEGEKDIRNQVIRATSESFKEDPLRVYRVARFASELLFEVNKQTISWMKELKGELSSLSKERVFEEFRKSLLSSKPSLFFDVLRRADVLEIHFAPIANLIGALQPEKYHPEGDAYNHTMIAVDYSVLYTKKPEIRFATLVHDLGKGVTPKKNYPHHYNHEMLGIPIVTKFSKNLGLPVHWRKCGETACQEHMRGGIFYRMKPSKQVEFIERVDKSYLGLDGLQIVVNCDRAREIKKEHERAKEEYQFAQIGKQCFEEITASVVAKKYGLSEGIELGDKLHEERVDWMKEKNQK